MSCVCEERIFSPSRHAIGLFQLRSMRPPYFTISSAFLSFDGIGVGVTEYAVLMVCGVHVCVCVCVCERLWVEQTE